MRLPPLPAHSAGAASVIVLLLLVKAHSVIAICGDGSAARPRAYLRLAQPRLRLAFPQRMPSRAAATSTISNKDDINISQILYPVAEVVPKVSDEQTSFHDPELAEDNAQGGRHLTEKSRVRKSLARPRGAVRPLCALMPRPGKVYVIQYKCIRHTHAHRHTHMHTIV